MNVYVRELVSALAQAGVDSTVFVRRANDEVDDLVEVEPGFRVVQVPAGPIDLPKHELPQVLDQYTKWVLDDLRHRLVDAIHANYWLSGVAGHQVKHELDLPLVSTFHTLARAKAETGDPEPQRRVDAEIDVIACSDAILANSPAERAQLIRLYGADPDRIEVVPPGVEHAFFSPGDQAGARAALDLPSGPLLLFAGRIQPLKGLDVAVRTLAALDRSDVRLVAVGGASGPAGRAEVARVRELIARLGLDGRVHFVDPQPHRLLSTFYRAADALLMPSRSESFGLVALEAAACGLPVVAADVGGLRTLVEDRVTGYLIDGRDPQHYADAVARILDDPVHAAGLGASGAEMARRYTWSTTAARLRRLYDDLSVRTPVACLAG
ncbi:MAG: glycosyltransferase [Acidimicrobiia bacterium]|nr:glycosyltransferase [Acidimicrobiia bacterium]